MNSSTAFRTSASELGGGRILILLLLFILAIYQFVNAGFSAFATICSFPIIVLVMILAFKKHIYVFWTLVLINAFLQWHSISLPSAIPMSMYNEGLEMLLIAMAIIDAKDYHFNRCANLMMFALGIWCLFCMLEILNDTCGMGVDIAAWYQGTRMLALQMLYAFIVFSLYINTPNILIRYLFIWGAIALFASFWVWKQSNIGFTHPEEVWLNGAGRVTHIIQGGTLIRYFSIYSDAANFGIGIASTAVAFIIFGITSKILKYKIFFFITGAAAAWATFPSGTRTAIACLIIGFIAYIFLSKSVKIAVPFTILFGLFVFMLAFTDIGQGNQQIRRMRSAFDKDDASANVREINQAAMRKYMKEAPWGLGVGLYHTNIPANNKYFFVVNTPSDSEYVSIWVRTGKIGLIVFLITTAIMLIGACRIVLFKLKSPSLRGIGAGLCCAFVSQQLGGYGNMVLMQFPNCLFFYGGLTIVYILPLMENEWIIFEEKKLAAQKEKKILRLKKKQGLHVQ